MASAMIRILPANEGDDDVVLGVAARMAGYLSSYRPLLPYPQQRVHLGHMIHGLTSDLERKSSEPIAIMQGLPRRVLQNFVGMAEWDWEPLRKQQRREVAAEIGLADGVLIIDGSAVPKKGTETVGVGRQWCGRLGKVDSCVVGVHGVYVGLDGQAALVDSQLYLQETWTSDQVRRDKVHIPPDVNYRTKIELGLDMVQRMVPELPFKWVTADEEYGRSSPFRDGIREAHKFYVLEVPCNTMVRAVEGVGSRQDRRADEMADLLRRSRSMTKIMVAFGEKHPIWVQAFMVKVKTNRGNGKMIRETLLCTIDASGDKHFYLAHLPQRTTLTVAVRRAGSRHRVEEVFAEAKGDVGMDHFECRAWHGWHHHMTLVQIAHWFLVREQRRLGGKMSWDHHQHAPSNHRQGRRATLDPYENSRVAVL